MSDYRKMVSDSRTLDRSASLDNHINTLKKLRQELSLAGWVDLYINIIDSYEEYGSTYCELHLTGQRPETDAEAELRRGKEIAAAKIREAEEKQLLAQLQAKYGG